MKFSRLFKPKKEEDFLVLDFGKNSVKGIVYQPKGKEVIIKDFQTEKIDRFGVYDGKDFELEIVKKAGSKVIEKLRVKNEISEFRKILGFSPDIVKAKVFNISFKREKIEERIDEKEKEEIYRFIFKESEKQLFKEEKLRDIQILKRKILKEKISGYGVPSILGFKGKNLDFKVLLVFLPKVHFNFVEFLKKELGLESAAIFHPVEGLVDFLDSRDKNPKIFLDIGAENTLVVFLKEELEFIDQFSIGGYDFTKEISKKLGLRENDAEVLKEDFSKKKLSSKIEKRVEEIILPILNLWEKSFEEKIKDKVKFFVFSGEVYLFGGGGLMPPIKKIITEKLKVEKVKFLLADDLPLRNKTKISFSPQETSSLLLTLSKEIYEKKDY